MKTGGAEFHLVPDTNIRMLLAEIEEMIWVSYWKKLGKIKDEKIKVPPRFVLGCNRARLKPVRPNFAGTARNSQDCE